MMKSVEAYKSELSKPNAYWMAKISKEVYVHGEKQDTPDEKKILDSLKKEDPGFKSVYGVSKNSAQAAMIEHDEYLCMAFRGTDQTRDWYDNIDAFQKKALFGSFHRGFWNSVEDVWTPLFDVYQEFRSAKRRPLFICGHSLGGAMATIAAARFIFDDLPFISAYSFGQPRALAVDTARIFNVEAKSRYFRFVNNNDIVTRVPTRSMGYSHCGTMLYISDSQNVYKEPGFWFRFLDKVDGAIDSLREKGIDAIGDHDMDNYIEAIKKWAS